MLGFFQTSSRAAGRAAPFTPPPASPRAPLQPAPLQAAPHQAASLKMRRDGARRSPSSAAARGTARPGLPIPRLDARLANPRQIGELSMELYLAGWLSFEESSLLGFQPELHPEYDRTIGALTGEPAEPDRPRDFISLWQDRRAFELRHNPGDFVLHQRIERIISVLIAASSSFSAVSAAA